MSHTGEAPPAVSCSCFLFMLPAAHSKQQLLALAPSPWRGKELSMETIPLVLLTMWALKQKYGEGMFQM